MSAPMVRAVLEGTKNQTRRVMKPQPCAGWNPMKELVEIHDLSLGEKGLDKPLGMGICNHDGDEGYVSKYGIPGDLLWVRETFRLGMKSFVEPQIIYRADDEEVFGAPWKPSIFMPRAASRITLEITQIGVERLQDISEADAVDEGIESAKYPHPQADTVYRNYLEDSKWFNSPVSSYRSLWEKINGEDSWNENPWVWKISLKRIKP